MKHVSTTRASSGVATNFNPLRVVRGVRTRENRGPATGSEATRGGNRLARTPREATSPAGDWLDHVGSSSEEHLH